MRFGSLAAMLSGPFVPSCSAEVVIGLARGVGRDQVVADVDIARKVIRDLTVEAFPDGSTQILARGTYKQSGHTVREPSIVIQLIDPVFGDRRDVTRVCLEFQERVSAFAEQLARLFEQQSELVVTRNAGGRQEVAFVEQGSGAQIPRGARALVKGAWRRAA